MPIDKPYHRMYRPMVQGPNSPFSGWAYVLDKSYARSPDHYVRAYLLIQKDLERLFEYVEPSPEAKTTFSFRIHELLMRTCIEVEANFKAILDENTFTPAIDKNTKKPIYNMRVYKRVERSHHLSKYELVLPMWNGERRLWKPFEGWATGNNIDWYQAYNASKHDRQQEFKKANLEVLISAVAGLLALISAQFQTQDFTTGADNVTYGGYDYHEMQASIGGLFRIAYPTDWTDAEKYDFDWSKLKDEPVRFQKFNYDTQP